MTRRAEKNTQKSVKEEFPLYQLYFYLTEGCNLACRHCWLSPVFDPDGEQRASLPVELFETAIHEAKPLGLQGVKLTGGEPLLHPHFATLLDIVRREELAVTVETNGLLCSPEMAAEIAKSPRRFVAVSIDGANADTHDRIRGVPGSFKQARNAVQHLVDAGISPQVIMSLMRSNLKEVDALVQMAEELGAASVKFNIVEPTGRGEKIHETPEELDLHELIKLGRYIDMELSQRTTLRLWYSSPLAFRPLSKLAHGGTDFCHILGILGVLANGEYALCGIGAQVSELVFGKIGETPLERVWRNNDVLKALRKGLPDRLSGVCSRCVMKAACLGSCLAQNYYRSHDLWNPFWFCEQAEKMGLFPESRLTKT